MGLLSPAGETVADKRAKGMESHSDRQSGASELDGFSSAAEMLQALRQHRISAVELLDLHLRRIERYNPTLNAVVARNDEAAHCTAAMADKARSQGKDRPLLGLPLTIKDCPRRAGVRRFLPARSWVGNEGSLTQPGGG